MTLTQIQDEHDHMGLDATKRVFWVSEKVTLKTSLLGYRGQLENWNSACSKSRYDTFQKANYKDADQSARMHRLVYAFVIHKPPKTGFLTSRPIWKGQW